MDHFVMLPVNENGVFWQPQLVSSALQDAMTAPPFRFGDLFIYSHGWWTVANEAMVEYSQFTIEFTKNLLTTAPPLRNPPEDTFGIGLHWPSTLSEDPNSLAQETLQATTYYQMGARAEQVGATGLYAAITLMLTAHMRTGAPTLKRMNLVGHSFGCRVVSSALQRLATELAKPTADPKLKEFVLGLHINLVLLQAAYKHNELDVGGDYDQLVTFPNLRILITTSQLDKALNYWFPKAERLTNIVHLTPSAAVALGAGIPPIQPYLNALAPGGGPTPASYAAFVPTQEAISEQPPNPPLLTVAPGFSHGMVPTAARMVVVDLTPLHSAHLSSGEYVWQSFGGSHCDIASIEIYALIAGFCFNR
jgi:hypothetical protein